MLTKHQSHSHFGFFSHSNPSPSDQNPIFPGQKQANPNSHFTPSGPSCKVENVKNGWKYTLNRTLNDRSYKTVPYFIITVKPHWYGHWRGHRKCLYNRGVHIKQVLLWKSKIHFFYRNTTASHLTSLNITKFSFCGLCPWKHTGVSRKSIKIL